MNSKETREYVRKANLVILDGQVAKSRDVTPSINPEYIGDYKKRHWDDVARILVIESSPDRLNNRAIFVPKLKEICSIHSVEVRFENFLAKHGNELLDKLEVEENAAYRCATSGKISGIRLAFDRFQQYIMHDTHD